MLPSLPYATTPGRFRRRTVRRRALPLFPGRPSALSPAFRIKPLPRSAAPQMPQKRHARAADFTACPERPPTCRGRTSASSQGPRRALFFPLSSAPRRRASTQKKAPAAFPGVSKKTLPPQKNTKPGRLSFPPFSPPPANAETRKDESSRVSVSGGPGAALVQDGIRTCIRSGERHASRCRSRGWCGRGWDRYRSLR